jgi:hypothetical protein
MSDKPHDVIGFDSARGVAKHGFVRSPSGVYMPFDASRLSNVTSNMSDAAPRFTLDELLEALKALKKITHDPTQITHAHCGARYMEALKAQVSKFEMRGGFAATHGFRFNLDPEVPPDVIEFRNFNDQVVYAECL